MTVAATIQHLGYAIVQLDSIGAVRAVLGLIPPVPVNAALSGISCSALYRLATKTPGDFDGKVPREAQVPD